MTKIVQISENATLLGGARVSDRRIALALSIAPILVAADGGAQRALAFGQVPAAVIGDFDSISQAAMDAIPAERLHRIAEQDSTDFEKVLTRVAAPLRVGVGFSGARVDHELAAFNTLVRHAALKTVLLGARDVTFVAPPEMALNVRKGTRVSLFPLREVKGRSDGLRWPIDGLDFAPGGQSGTSNMAEGTVRLEMDAPGMLVILPAGQFSEAVRALSAAPVWP